MLRATGHARMVSDLVVARQNAQRAALRAAGQATS